MEPRIRTSEDQGNTMMGPGNHIFCLKNLRNLLPARVILYLLSFTGFLVSFMMRTDINIAMVAMVEIPPPSIEPNTTISEPLYCYDTNLNTTHDNDSVTQKEIGEFKWDPAIQSTIISSFYWCYVLSQVAGGILVQKFGTKSVFGYSQLATALSSLLIPQAAEVHYSLLIILRSIQGVASGFTWPAMYAMIGHWIPPSERSRFMSSFQGFTIGIGVTYPLCGFIIAHYGWRVVFYVTGSLGCIWCIFWWFLAFDTPQEHPRISKQELAYIQKCTRATMANSKMTKVPWMSILTSPPAWAIGITTFGRIWVHYTFIIPGPLYMKTVLGFSIQKNGVLNGAPFLLSYLSSVIFCYVADWLVTKNILSLTTVRKIFTALSQVVPGLLVLLIGYLGCNITLVLVAWFIAVTLITASYAGAMANIVDIGPNFAGPILAFAQTIHMSASFVSPLVAGALLKDNTTLGQWRKVFGVTSVVAVVTYFVYQAFGTSEVQKWNYPDNEEPPLMIDQQHSPKTPEKSSKCNGNTPES
ncbi:major Facilitator Superfamily Transporter 17 [Rhodnius prolixus]|uniref:major Facilitator Superfamily Transporter 17 n=1 Tax=Rhodnius prolixus TaxID=13249 RepID=UPI003D18D25D